MLLAPLTLFVTARYFPALDQGYDSCPCVDPYPLSGPGTGFANCSGILRDGACYPSGYGARGCRAYDNSEFVGGDAPIECQAETWSRAVFPLPRVCEGILFNCYSTRSDHVLQYSITTHAQSIRCTRSRRAP